MGTSQSGYSFGGKFKWTTQRKFCPVITVEKGMCGLGVWQDLNPGPASTTDSKYFWEGLYFQLLVAVVSIF